MLFLLMPAIALDLLTMLVSARQIYSISLQESSCLGISADATLHAQEFPRVPWLVLYEEDSFVASLLLRGCHTGDGQLANNCTVSWGVSPVQVRSHWLLRFLLLIPKEGLQEICYG